MENLHLFSVCNTKEQYKEIFLKLAAKIGVHTAKPGNFEIPKSGIIIFYKPVGDSGYLQTCPNTQESIEALVRSCYNSFGNDEWPCDGMCEGCTHSPCDMDRSIFGSDLTMTAIEKDTGVWHGRCSDE